MDKHKDGKRLEQQFLDAVYSAINPLIPGMNLSVSLNSGSKRSFGKKRRMLELQKEVDDALLNVVGHLPGSCELSDVGKMLEPEATGLRMKGVFQGPLNRAINSRHHGLCSVPIVVDYMSYKFTSGMKQFTAAGLLHPLGKPPSNVMEIFIAAEELLGIQVPLADLERVHLTWFPTLQFYAFGLTGASKAFYQLPAARMIFDTIIFSSMLVLFASQVGTVRDAGKIEHAEIVFYCYVLGSIFNEIEEVRALRSATLYFSDIWNCMDVALLLSLTIAFFARVTDLVTKGNGDGGSDWDALFVSQFFLAVSSPLFFWRILFLAQVSTILGPLVQTIFLMCKELVMFGTVIITIMFGFSSAFHALFGGRSGISQGPPLEGFSTYANTILTLFRAMLGDFVFEDFSEAEYGDVGKVLLVVYLTIMSIMLLNLLIAVLSTVHSEVNSNAEKEFNVSRAHIIQQYSRVVRHDRLPSYLNLVPAGVVLVLWVTQHIIGVFQDPEIRQKTQRDMGNLRNRCRANIGLLLWWLGTGPLAIVTGSLLWFLSMPVMVWRFRRNGEVDRWLSKFGDRLSGEGRPSESFMLLRYTRNNQRTSQLSILCWNFVVVVFCMIGVPVFLTLLWLLHALRCLGKWHRYVYDSGRAEEWTDDFLLLRGYVGERPGDFDVAGLKVVVPDGPISDLEGKLDVRMSEHEAKLVEKIGSLEATITSKFDYVLKRSVENSPFA